MTSKRDAKVKSEGKKRSRHEYESTKSEEAMYDIRVMDANSNALPLVCQLKGGNVHTTDIKYVMYKKKKLNSGRAASIVGDGLTQQMVSHDDVPQNRSRSFYVGVLNNKSKKLKIYKKPIEMYTMQPSHVITDNASEYSQGWRVSMSESNNGLSTGERSKLRDTKFGDRRTRLSVQEAKFGIKMEDEMRNAGGKRFVKRVDDSFVPPYNKQARKRTEIFNVKDILHEDEVLYEKLNQDYLLKFFAPDAVEYTQSQRTNENDGESFRLPFYIEHLISNYTDQLASIEDVQVILHYASVIMWLLHYPMNRLMCNDVYIRKSSNKFKSTYVRPNAEVLYHVCLHFCILPNNERSKAPTSRVFQKTEDSRKKLLAYLLVLLGSLHAEWIIPQMKYLAKDLKLNEDKLAKRADTCGFRRNVPQNEVFMTSDAPLSKETINQKFTDDYLILPMGSLKLSQGGRTSKRRATANDIMKSQIEKKANNDDNRKMVDEEKDEDSDASDSSDSDSDSDSSDSSSSDSDSSSSTD